MILAWYRHSHSLKQWFLNNKKAQYWLAVLDQGVQSLKTCSRGLSNSKLKKLMTRISQPYIFRNKHELNNQRNNQLTTNITQQDPS